MSSIDTQMSVWRELQSQMPNVPSPTSTTISDNNLCITWKTGSTLRVVIFDDRAEMRFWEGQSMSVQPSEIVTTPFPRYLPEMARVISRRLAN